MTPRVPVSQHRTYGAPLHPLLPLPAQVGLAGGSSIPSLMLHAGVSPPGGTVQPGGLAARVSERQQHP